VQVESVLVLDVKHASGIQRATTPMKVGRDVWWDVALTPQPHVCMPEWVPAEHPLYLLYTSGSTGALPQYMHASAIMHAAHACIV
jgi:acetyl-CoA synthetase